MIKELGYPTELRAFLKSCGTSDQPVDPDGYSKPMRERVDSVLSKISDLMDKASTRSATDAQGTDKTEVESVQLGNTHIADMDKCPQDKCFLDRCRGDSCNLLYMFSGPFV